MTNFSNKIEYFNHIDGEIIFLAIDFLRAENQFSSTIYPQVVYLSY